MYRQYQSRTVSDEDLDRMLATADAAEEACNREPRFVVAEVDVADDDEINGAVQHVLDYVADASRDEHRRNIDGHDLLRAADACGLMLGTVFESPCRPYKIVQLDYDVCTDAIAWAAIADLPGWVAHRYNKLVSRRSQRQMPGAITP
jgi:nitroreductase